MKGDRAWRLAAGGLVAGVLLFFFLRGVAWSEIGSAMRSADRADLALVLLSTVFVYAFRAWRWGYLLAPLARVSFPRLLSATVVGFMTGLVVPRAGEVVRPYLISRRHAISTSAGFATIILERLVDLITVLGLFFLYLYVLPIPAAQTRGPMVGVLKAAGGVAVLGSLGVLGVLFAFHVHAAKAMAVCDRLLARLPERLGRPLSELLRAFGDGLAVLQAPPAHLLAILGQSALVWLAIGISIFFNNRAFGIHLPVHASFLIMGFLTVGVAVPTPGMVGGFHEAFLLAMTQAFGVDKSTAAAAGISMHALSNLPVLLGGLALLPSEGLTLGGVADMTADAQGKNETEAPGTKTGSGKEDDR